MYQKYVGIYCCNNFSNVKWNGKCFNPDHHPQYKNDIQNPEFYVVTAKVLITFETTYIIFLTPCEHIAFDDIVAYLFIILNYC
jgi:hypothetical protein